MCQTCVRSGVGISTTCEDQIRGAESGWTTRQTCPSRGMGLDRGPRRVVGQVGWGMVWGCECRFSGVGLSVEWA